MGKDLAYIGGVVATKDKTLLKEKLNRLCELTADDAFRFLTESGYGSGAEGVFGPFDYEKLINAEELSLDDFIREYAPTERERNYLLAPHDFHNAKALFKAKVLGTSAEGMLGPMGLVDVSTLADCVQRGEYEGLDDHLAEALRSCEKLLEEQGNISGLEVGAIFEKAMYAALASYVKHNRALKGILSYRADVTNLLTAARARDEAEAQKLYVTGGKLENKKLSLLLTDDFDGIEKAFEGTIYAQFVAECVEAKRQKLPFTAAEKRAAGAELDAFEKYRYDMEGNHPFLYYVFRKRAENADVRIIFVCLGAGMSQAEIKKRRRTA
jgi:vacuolar-type H+-ATPase subunit C/Vma6